MKYIFVFSLFVCTLFANNTNIDSDIRYFEQKDLSEKIDITKKSFQKYTLKHSNFGFTQSIYWLKIELLNSSKFSQKYVLHLPYTLLDYIDIYELKNNKLLLRREYGDLREYNNDSFITDPSFITTLDANKTVTYYYKIQTQGSMNIELIINNYEDFIDYSLEKSIVFSFYFGSVFIMLIYNFILYLSIKDRSYLFYLLFHINYLFFALSLNGYSSAYLWSNIPIINTVAIPFLMSVGSSLAVIFTIDFLNIKFILPKLYKVLNTLFWINIVMTLLTLILTYREASILASLISLVSIIVILGSSVYTHFKGSSPYAKFFALAWGTLLLGIFIIHFRNLGLLPVNTFTSHSPLIGAFLELILLSIALAYRYNIQRAELSTKDMLLYKQSRLASMGEMINNIAHQWRQPLNRVNISLAVISEVLQDEKIHNSIIRKKIENSEKNIEYMSQTIDDFSKFFAPNKEKYKFIIYDTLQKSLNLLESRLEGINIHMPKDEKKELFGFENEYIQIILIILNNAIDNFSSKDIENKDIFISIKQVENIVILSIMDNGGGINKDIIEKIFDPYFTTKFQKEGTGIGLYMAKMLIENSMHGELSVSSNNANTAFEIKTTKD